MRPLAGRPSKNRGFPAGRFLAAGLAALLALASWPEALAQVTAQRAGQVAAQIPAGQIERPAGNLPADVGAAVLWDDLVTTLVRGRVRVTLDDGSILNIGSGSNLRVVKHDATTQQTDLILTYGQMRVRTKLRQPAGSFTVRTSTAVAGVIGTDFWILSTPTMTHVIVFEGALTITGVAGGTVMVGAGQGANIGANQPPSSPSSPSQADYNNAIQDTNVGEPLPQPPGPRPAATGGTVPWIVAVAGIVAVVVASLVVTREKRQPPPRRPRDGGGGE